MSNIGFSQSDEYNPEKEKDAIRSKLSKLSPRLLYLTIEEICQDDIYFKEDVDYLTNKLIILKMTAEELGRYINVAKDIILDDETVDWICKDLRVALWFDHYISYKCTKRNNLHLINPYILEIHAIVSTCFIKNCIRKFDTCRITMNEEYNKEPILKDEISKRKRYDGPNSVTNLESNSESYSARLSDERLIDQMKQKIDFIAKTKIKYNRNKTSYKNLDWLDKKDELQLLWAKDYLFSQKLLIHSNSFFAESLSELYDQICASIDAIDIDSIGSVDSSKPEYISLGKKDILRKMRGAWSQKKFRDKKDAESAQEYFLSRPHMNKLKKLSEAFGVTSKDYIQQLIDDAYDSTN